MMFVDNICMFFLRIIFICKTVFYDCILKLSFKHILIKPFLISIFKNDYKNSFY